MEENVEKHYKSLNNDEDLQDQQAPAGFFCTLRGFLKLVQLALVTVYLIVIATHPNAFSLWYSRRSFIAPVVMGAVVLTLLVATSVYHTLKLKPPRFESDPKVAKFEFGLSLFCFALTAANTAVSGVFSQIYETGEIVFGFQIASSLVFAASAVTEYRNVRGVYPWGSTSLIPRSALLRFKSSFPAANVTNNYYYVIVSDQDAVSEERVRAIVRQSSKKSLGANMA